VRRAKTPPHSSAGRTEQPETAAIAIGRDNPVMDPTVHFITLGVPDLDQARAFYVDGLGWQPVFEVAGAITFIQVGHGLLLGLFGADDLDADIGQSGHAVGPSPFTLAQVLQTEAEVTATLAAAAAAGATILKPAQHADFGGFHGYFADPSGFRWEIATNPGWSVAADGTVSIGPIGA
jgi:catechol 2,3-dioxygenase-like lactoylglutathione lyase family enzyme